VNKYFNTYSLSHFTYVNYNVARQEAPQKRPKIQFSINNTINVMVHLKKGLKTIKI